MADANKMVKVLVPNRGFSGIRMGVKFKNGEAVCLEEKAQRIKRSFGYQIEPISEKPPSDDSKLKAGDSKAPGDTAGDDNKVKLGDSKPSFNTSKGAPTANVNKK